MRIGALQQQPEGFKTFITCLFFSQRRSYLTDEHQKYGRDFIYKRYVDIFTAAE